MLYETLAVLYFLVPAYFANMAPVLAKKIKFFDHPLDFGIKVRGKRLFGANKTFRGLIFGMLAAAAVFLLQKILYEAGIIQFNLIDYSSYTVLLGAIIGFITILGDAIESMVKRQLDIRPGKPFVPWDQLDFVIANYIMMIFIVDVSWMALLLASVIILIGDIIVQYSAYRIGMKKDIL